jgi:1,4-alpha-glucan branching enzyme
MTEAARQHEKTRSAFTDRTLKQLARELLLAQSSDWAFLMKTGTAVDYATRRTNDHLLRFTRLWEMLESGQPDEGLLAVCEERDNLFPNVNWKHYL